MYYVCGAFVAIAISSCATKTIDYPEIESCSSAVCLKLKNTDYELYRPVLNIKSTISADECVL